MFEIERYNAQRAEEWNHFIDNAKNGTFLLKRQYMDYHSDRFDDCSLMIRDKESRLVAVLPANISGKTFASHQGLTYGGLVMSDECCTEDVCCIFTSINEWLHENGFSHVIYKPSPWIYHRLPSEEDLFAIIAKCNARLTRRNVATVVVPDANVKWKRDRRYASNKAKTNGIIIAESNDFERFWEILSENLMSKYGARPVHNINEIKLLKERFEKEIRLWAAFNKEGEMVAGTVLYLNENDENGALMVHSQYISATEEGKRLHAIDALFNHIINIAYADAKFIDMGTSNLPTTGELHSSLIHQKEGFGGRAVCYDTYEWEI